MPHILFEWLLHSYVGRQCLFRLLSYLRCKYMSYEWHENLLKKPTITASFMFLPFFFCRPQDKKIKQGVSKKYFTTKICPLLVKSVAIKNILVTQDKLLNETCWPSLFTLCCIYLSLLFITNWHPLIMYLRNDCPDHDNVALFFDILCWTLIELVSLTPVL